MKHSGGNHGRPSGLPGTERLQRRFRALLGAGLLGAVLAAHAQTLTTVYAFDGALDGASPFDTLVYANGLLYGTTSQWGPHGYGSVFSFDPVSGVQTVLHAFTGKTGAGSDAGWPMAGLSYQNGTLYGASEDGGALGLGAVYKIDAATGTETTIHGFLKLNRDGYLPDGTPLLINGALYGTTREGGLNGIGVLYRIDPVSGKETVLHTFMGNDGAEPHATLVYNQGVLYGTAASGGFGSGVVFAYDLATRREKVLHRFTGFGDGAAPLAGLVYQDGKLYGTTLYGGDPSSIVDEGPGTVFEIDLATGKETVLHRFNWSGDGTLPNAGLLYHDGLLYGTTERGGAYDKGTVFTVDPATMTETLLHSFTEGEDGSEPWGGLVFVDGSFYGTTSFGGGASNSGTIFRLTP